MGMRISGSSSTAATQSTGATQWQQRQQGVKDLMAALKSGNLGAAQQAYASLSGTGTGSTGSTAVSSTAVSSTAVNSSTGSSTGAQASSPLAQIGQALQNGDLAGAQQAAQAWQAQRSGQHHGHHGHHGQPPSATPPAASNPISTTANGPGGLLDVQA